MAVVLEYPVRGWWVVVVGGSSTMCERWSIIHVCVIDPEAKSPYLPHAWRALVFGGGMAYWNINSMRVMYSDVKLHISE